MYKKIINKLRKQSKSVLTITIYGQDLNT